ncbi:SAM-dependent methyltransferase [Porphyromonas macacae]|uniref:Ribosomal RNA large subunit methyltransferase I n=1 Tax=Porphyromonas macacae TaxID=28115 RepID=A0A0A2EBT3_9PORP|nr:class I SAM-dependent rRNA methyltransferase [Porphyromonas macacae]KGN74900.1 SAM-dependent methyltransferase [Porphyromonas macacae]SUB89082.1 Ribosomal RNA large subunit methyltransferase I [Porphyromonas macacae]
MTEVAKPSAIIKLLPKRDESIKRFHPWVFSGAIRAIQGEPQEGDLVKVVSHDEEPLAIGHYAPESITVRILSFDADEEVNEDFWSRKLATALRLRQDCNLIRKDNNVMRLVHGEGDGMPGLIIDIYGRTAVLQAHSAGMHYARISIANALKNILGNIIDAVYYKSENTLPFKANLDAHDGFLTGRVEEEPVQENGILFYPDWSRGQKTGFFIDQRNNRALLEHYAFNKKVLNTFCYTGGFSLYALRGGAQEVHSVDSSAKAMSLTDKNVGLNIKPEEALLRHKSITTDAFKYLEEMPQGYYDLIVLDPPAFAKHRKVLRNALQGYRRINAEAFKKIAPGGILFTFSCSQAVSREEFRLSVFSAAASTGRRVRILHQLTQPEDHPINIYHPEGEYLKGLVLRVE